MRADFFQNPEIYHTALDHATKLAVWWNRLGISHASNHVRTLVTVKLITVFGLMTGDLWNWLNLKSWIINWNLSRQNCSMMFGPWMNNENEIDYVTKRTYVSTTSANENTEWKLVSAVVTKKIINVASKDGKYSTKFPNLFYFFVVERHSSLVSTVVGGNGYFT